MSGSAAIPAYAGGQVFLINENCEGTGIPSGWSTVTADPDWDYTTTNIGDTGSQSLHCTSAHGSLYTFTGQTPDVYCKAKIRIVTGISSPSSNAPFISLRSSGGTDETGIYILGNAQPITIRAGGGITAGTGNMLLNTTYYTWLDFHSGATCIVSLNSTNVKPTGSGDAVSYATKTGNTATVTNLQLYGSQGEVIIDDIFVSATAIA